MGEQERHVGAEMIEHELPEGIIYQGNVFKVLPKLPKQLVQLVVTSPPYWNLRDYETGTWEGGNDHDCKHKVRINTPESVRATSTLNYSTDTQGHQKEGYKKVCKRCGARRVDDQLGLEEVAACNGAFTGQECRCCYVCRQVAVYRLVWDVLRNDGVLVINCGDSYRNKNLQGIPWRLALALQADGWLLRSALPWVSRSKMPESTEDRPASGLEYVFVFAKGIDYYWDVEAVRVAYLNQDAVHKELQRQKKRRDNKSGLKTGNDYVNHSAKWSGGKDINDYHGRNFRNSDLWFQSIKPPHGLTGLDDEVVGLDVTAATYNGDHYAAYPLALVKPFILAATSQKGCCPRCGACWRRVIEKERTATRPGKDSKVGKGSKGEVVGNRDPQRHVTSTKTVGWEPGCQCNAGAPVSSTVLDPFGGVMTTCLAAQRLGRRFMAVELSEEYVAAGLKRLRSRGQDRGAEVKGQQGGLFGLLKKEVK